MPDGTAFKVVDPDNGLQITKRGLLISVADCDPRKSENKQSSTVSRNEMALKQQYENQEKLEVNEQTLLKKDKLISTENVVQIQKKKRGGRPPQSTSGIQNYIRKKCDKYINSNSNSPKHEIKRKVWEDLRTHDHDDEGLQIESAEQRESHDILYYYFGDEKRKSYKKDAFSKIVDRYLKKKGYGH